MNLAIFTYLLCLISLHPLPLGKDGCGPIPPGLTQSIYIYQLIKDLRDASLIVLFYIYMYTAKLGL